MASAPPMAVPVQVRPLKFDVVRCSSFERAYPPTNLTQQSTLQQGWICERFCEFPQRVVLTVS